MISKWRLVLIAILMALSVAVDSVYYLISALTDGLFMVAIVVIAMPLWRKKTE